MGRNEYFVLNRDYGEHDITATYYDMLAFRYEEGEDKLFDQVEEDMVDILGSQNLTIEDYTNLFGFIWFYFKYRFDYKKIKSNWNISNVLKKSFITKYRELAHSNDMSNVLRINNLVQQNYGFNVLEL